MYIYIYIYIYVCVCVYTHFSRIGIRHDSTIPHQALPAELGHCTSVTRLSMPFNSLKELPVEIAHLHKVETLNPEPCTLNHEP